MESVGSICYLTKLPGRASLGASNLVNQQVTPTTAMVIIAVDRGDTGEREAKMLATRLHGQGIAVRMALPPEDYDDWNEALIAGKLPHSNYASSSCGRPCSRPTPRCPPSWYA